MRLFDFVTLLLTCLLGYSSIAHSEVQSDFKVSRTVAGVGVVLEFESTSTSNTGEVLNLSWDFGDGSPKESKERVSHAYSKADTYLVTLVAESSAEKSEKSVKIEIKENNAPTAEFYIKKTDVLVGQKVTFMSMAKDKDKDIESFEWQIDGVVVSKKKADTYVFDSPGIYKLRHKVTDKFGSEGTFEKTIDVKQPNVLPEARLEIEREKLSIGEQVALRARARDPDGEIKGYFWRFGELGDFIEGKNEITHTFVREGFERVWLKVVDDRGGEATLFETVFIDDPTKPPNVSIDVGIGNHSVNEEIDFTLKISGVKSRVEKVDWNFGDGTKVDMPDVLQNISHSFKVSGEYLVSATLVMTNSKQHLVAEKIVIGAERKAVLTTPNQVIIKSSSYLELVPTQTRIISFAAFSEFGGSVTPTSVTWSSSNSNVSIVSSSGSSATIRGDTAGDAIVKVNVNGVDSQELTVAVQAFSNSIAVAKDGEYFDELHGDMYVAVDRTTGTYNFSLAYNNFVASRAVGHQSTKIGDQLYFELPTSKSSMDITVAKNDLSENFSFTKSGLKSFVGRTGFLFLPYLGVENVSIEYDDDRFLKLDEDFSISFWFNTNFESSYLILTGDYSIVMTGQKIQITDDSASRELRLPYKTQTNPGKWAHIALTYVASTRIAKGYYDGYFIGSVVIPNSPKSESPSMKFTKTNVAQVSIDELRFWNKALSTAEVKAELFSPVSVPSSDLVASFSFDNGSSFTQSDDNSGNWLLKFNSTNVPKATGNMIIVNKIGEIDSAVNTSNSYNFSLPVEHGKAMFSVPAGTFSTNEQLEMSAYSCIGLCKVGINALRQLRLSSVIHISPLSIPLKYSEVRLPFDSQSPLIVDPRKIKVAKSEVDIFGYVQEELYEPTEINIERGYVSFPFAWGASYWLVIPDGVPTVEYSNTNLFRSLVSYGGARTYYTNIPSANTSYILTGDMASSYVDSITCNGVGVTPSYFPVTLTGLSNSLNYCFINYLSTVESPQIAHRDLIVIQRY